MFVPNNFYKIATRSGLSKDLATLLYTQKVHKKSTFAIAHQLVSQGKKSTLSKAQRFLSDIWKEFKQSNFESNSKAVRKPDFHHEVNNESFFESARKSLDTIIGPFSPSSRKVRSQNILHRVVIASDFHIPFESPEGLRCLLEDPASTLVIGGDFLDMYAGSRFRKNSDHITISTELARGKAILELLTRKFDTVYYIKGNHDLNALKRVGETFPQLLPLMVDPMKLLAADFPNMKELSVTIHGTAPSLPYFNNFEMNFAGQLGDVLVGHFENFSGFDAGLKLDQWLTEWGHITKLNPQIATQAHNHRLGMFYTPTGRAVIHTGCMCRPMEYQLLNHGKYAPPTLGFVALNIVNGVGDKNSIELIKVEERY